MSNEKKMDCPYCGSENHLYLNVAKQVFYCFKCGAKGRAKALEDQGYVFPKSKENLLKPRDVSFRLAEGLSDPPEYYPTTTDSVLYLTDRGVHGTIMRLLEDKIYDTPRGLLFFYPDEDYWQVRHWSAFAPPRWLNPTTAPRTPGQGVCYHLRSHFDSDSVVLVEGVVDALRVAPYGNVAALLSTNMHEAQLFHLSQIYTNALIMLDRDVTLPKKLSSLSKVSGFFPRSSIVEYAAIDPGSATDEVIKEAINVNR